MDQKKKVYEIHGIVRSQKNDPLRDARVVVWWQHIRARKELAAGETSELGTYHLRYELPEQAPQPMLLVVEALSEHLDAPLFSPLTEAQPNLEIDLSFEPPDQSEWATLVRSIEPLLDGLKLSELVESATHQDLSFLARELDKSSEALMLVAVSARLEAAFSVPAPAFYAFLRQRIPAALPSPLIDASQNFTLIDALVHRIGSLIFALSAQVETQTLTAAIALDLIGPQFTEQIPQLVSTLQSMRSTDLLNQAYLVGNATLAQLLDVVALPQAKQQAFAQALATNAQSMRNFWRTLGDGTHGFTAAEASSIERILSVGAFVKNYVPLIEKLVQGFSSGTYNALPDLARLSLQDWVNLVNQTGPPPGIDAAGTASPTQVFASVIYSRVTRAYPTAALSNRIATAELVPQPQQKPLAQFFQNNVSLELIKDSIPAYLASQGAKAFTGISAQDQAAVVDNARSFQRVLRVAPNADVAQNLLRVGIKSATHIATIGEQQFFIKATAAGLTKPEAKQAYQAAAQRYASVISLYTRFNRDAIGVWPKMMGLVSDINLPAQEAIRRDQSLATLFGSQDYCTTDDCTSILSPAAYLCDLLLWLRNHPQGTKTALDVLDSRRSDIRHLLLNCPNTDTELPYIDLVNELLADKISPPIDSISTSYVQAALTNGRAYFYIVTAVNYVGESAASSQVSATPAAPTVVPAAPTSVVATPGDAQVSLSWDALPGATSYNIYWSTAPGVTTSNGNIVAGVTNPYIQTALLNGTTYYYIITAVNAVGEGAASPQVSAAPSAAAAVAAAPTGVTATTGDNQIAIGWTPVAGVTSYNIYWSTTSGVTTASGTRIPGAANPYLHASLINGTTYYYIVTAVNGIGESAPSSQVSATAAVPTLAPPAPTGVSVSPGNAHVTISWNAVPGATSYNIYWSTTPGVTRANGTEITGSRNPKWKQTSANKTAAELSAAPEYFNQGAYAILFDANYPFSLPYSAGLDELRTYLQNLKLPLWQLRQALLPISSATAAQQAAVAAERFGIAPHGQDLVTNPNFVSAAIAWNTGNPSVDVAPVDAFLQASSLSYESLLELLQIAWVQGGINIAIQGIDDTCMTSKQVLGPSPLDPGFLDRAHRFIRLWLATGYKMWELDLLLSAAAIGNGTLDQKALAALFSFRQLQDATGLAVNQTIAFYQNIDTSVHRDPDGTTALSLYAQIFLNAAVTSVAPDPDLGVVPTGGAVADPVLSDHLTGIQAALGVSGADAATLFSLTDNTLTLANLSLIYRVNALARASKFKISDLLTVAGLLSPTAANLAAALAPLLTSPAATLAFLAQAKVIQQSGLSLDALTYLLTPPSAALPAGWPTTTQMTQANITSALGAVQQAVVSLLAASTTLASPITTTSQTSITVASNVGFPAPNFSVSIGSETLLVTASGGPGNTIWTVLRGQQGTTAALATAGAAVSPTGGDINGAVIAAVAANAHTTTTTGLANDVTAFILNTFRVPGTTSTLVAVLTDLSFTGSTSSITPVNFPNQFLAVQLFDKVAVLVRGLRFVVADLTWLLTNAAVYGGLDFSQLPVTTAQPALAMSPLLTTLLLIKMARLWTAAPPSSKIQTLYDVIGGVSTGALGNAAGAQTALATITGWPAADIAAFATALGLTFPANYLVPASYDALRTLEAMATTTKATGSQLVNWGAVPPDEPTAEGMAAGVLAALKAQQPSNDAWLALAPTLMNPIRDRRAAALQACLIGQRDNAGNLIYGDANGLFNYFLIDTQMTSCMPTSRVVQAYIAVQIFVERCNMNLEVSAVVVDLTQDGTWSQWEWMSRYRIWQANREVFLYPENWLIESQRPNRTEIYQKLEQEVRQGQSTADYLETVVLNYIDRLDGLAHLLVTGTCEDSAGTIYVVARTLADPPVFYLRTYVNSAWTGWVQIPLDIKAHQVVPALYRGRTCLFWLDVKVANEPQQPVPAAQASSTSSGQNADRYVSLSVNFSIFRNGNWAPAQAARGKLFDKPIFDPRTQATDAKSIEALYTLKVQTQPPAPGVGVTLFLDVFRLGNFELNNQFNEPNDPLNYQITGIDDSVAIHLGRAVFDGRFSDLELQNLVVPKMLDNIPVPPWYTVKLLAHAKSVYGPDAEPLLQLSAPDPNLTGEPAMEPEAGALAAFAGIGQSSTQLTFTSLGALDQNVGPLLNTAQLPFRVFGPDTDLNFDPASYFFFQDNRRSYWVENQKFYWTGSTWSPVVPSDPSTAPYQVRYTFHPFYHAFTRLLWNQLGSGGFDLLYDPDLQQAPDSVDPGYSEVFSFANNYQPTWRVTWDHADAATLLASPISAVQTTISVTNNIWVPSPAFYVYIGNELMQVTSVTDANRTAWTVSRGQGGTVATPAFAGAAVTPTFATQDRQFLDFSYSGTFSVYNWELFYHIPLYIAQLLSQNQQFQDAQTWYHYIFDPTRQGTDPVPQRFWIPKPLHNLTSGQILAQQINNLLVAVNQGDSTAVAQVENWRNNSFNPFLLADLRNGVPYMKSTVMSYLDNLIAWGDNLFSSESREALSEATLLYVIASQILGPTPIAVTPPQHADESFDQLEPALDAFANAMVEIENVIGGAGAGGSGGGGDGGGIPGPATFYFKIPSNPQLLGYWTTVANRLYNLRHCQNISGGALELALFDAPIDPGLLIAAQAAGVDLSSVLSNLGALLPNYRFTALYPQALDFVNAVRAYGASLQAALEKSDAGALALLQQTTQQQLLIDGNQVLDWQIQQAQNTIDALNQNLDLGNTKLNYYNEQSSMSSVINDAEKTGLALQSAALILNSSVAVANLSASISYLIPYFTFGISGFGGTPDAKTGTGGKDYGHSLTAGSQAVKALADVFDKGGTMANAIGKFLHTQDDWKEKAAETVIDIGHTQTQIAGANLALQIAQQNQILHQEQIDNIQKQIDFLNSKFTNDSLYDWMVGSLSATYFQSYQLAYQMCKQVERCYQFELGIENSSFIQFGYWDSLHKGLLAGETLNHDLRRMQASYLQQNARRFEMSRFVSLGLLNPAAFQQLLVTGACDFTLPELLFDNDYPGHYNRRLTRVSMTVVYPSPGKFDNVKATLTLVANQVRVKTDTSSGYAETPVGSDPRFLYNYAAVPQKIVMGNAQDDPGLFVTTIASNIADQRYLPFENAGVISSWHLDMPQANNEVDLSTVGDITLHLFYTALDGGGEFQQAVQANNAANVPTSGIKVFSAQNDFAAGSPTVDVPYPVSPWQAFLSTQKAIIGALPFQQDGTPQWQAFDNPPTAETADPANPGKQKPVNTDQVLTLGISPSKFPSWTRGKTITVASITVLAVTWTAPPATFVLAPQAPLPTALVTMTQVAGATEPNVCSTTITMPPNSPLGTWSLKLQQQGAADFQSLTKNQIGDVLLLVSYAAS